MPNLDSKLRYRVVATDNNKYHWFDRTTGKPLTYENGDETQFASLDEAIAAFIDGKLTVKMNEVME
jgi:hypothetical protein